MSNQTQPVKNVTQPLPTADRVRFGLFITLFGFIIFVIGAKPEWLGLDRSPVVGFVQICVFLIGLAIICLGGYIGLAALWGGEEKSIAADIGLRLIATGYVISVFTGMADVFGMTVQANPRIPFFGPWQQAGVEIGMAVVTIGMLMLVPFHLLPIKGKGIKGLRKE
jgi:hypothetical protein